MTMFAKMMRCTNALPLQTSKNEIYVLGTHELKSNGKLFTSYLTHFENKNTFYMHEVNFRWFVI